MAWAHAEFMNQVAKTGKKRYDLPIYTNVMLGENGFEEPGACYNSGAAVGRVLDIYKKVLYIFYLCNLLDIQNQQTHMYQGLQRQLFLLCNP